MEKNDSIFSGPIKSVRYWICQTGHMCLWIALYRIKCMDCFYGECKNSREEYKAAVKSFPYEVGDCRCKDCRYYRLTKKLI